jgi:hypothetical protein
MTTALELMQKSCGLLLLKQSCDVLLKAQQASKRVVKYLSRKPKSGGKGYDYKYKHETTGKEFEVSHEKGSEPTIDGKTHMEHGQAALRAKHEAADAQDAFEEKHGGVVSRGAMFGGPSYEAIGVLEGKRQHHESAADVLSHHKSNPIQEEAAKTGGRIKYNKGDINSALGAAKKLNGLHYVVATHAGYAVTNIKPALGQDYYKVEDGNVDLKKYDFGIGDKNKKETRKPFGDRGDFDVPAIKDFISKTVGIPVENMKMKYIPGRQGFSLWFKDNDTAVKAANALNENRKQVGNKFNILYAVATHKDALEPNKIEIN